MAKTSKPVPNGPSKKTGQKSGSGRGNNPPKVQTKDLQKPAVKQKEK